MPILAALLQEVGGHWIFAAPGAGAGSVAPLSPISDASHSWRALPIDEQLFNQQRESISIRTLLWLFHYLHDTSTQPSFNEATRSGWLAYSSVNEAFANALVEEHQNEQDEIVLVNDFHLMLAPYYFTTKAVNRKSTLAYFHHVPWCEPDYFGILPEWLSTSILESLLRCDFVGFHCTRWGDSFLACCDRFLPSAQIDSSTVVYRDHLTVVTTAPGPIDADVLADLDGQRATQQWRDELTRRAHNRRIIMRVDRMDLWKNLVRGFLSYEMLLRQRPQLATELWFCAITTLPRLQTDRHRRYQILCEDVVKRINDSFPGRNEAVSLLYPDGSESQRARAVAALSLGSATLVNPTYDGLNMVAKEATVINPRAQLLLSTNAGAYPQLVDIAAPIQPFDLCSTAAALEKVANGQDSRTTESVNKCVESLRRETPLAWLLSIVGRS